MAFPSKFILPEKPGLAVLVAISAVQPFSLNALAPATPALAKTLHADYGTIQLTLSLYLLTVAVVQLIMGPVSDKVGRRPCIVIGLGAYTLGSLVGALAPTTAVVLLARMIQAAGAGTAFALARAIVRDTSTTDEAASRIGYLTTVMVISPMIAPLVGGYIDAHASWRWIFALMVVIGCVVLLFAAARLPETRRLSTQMTTFRTIISAIPLLVTDRAFLGPALAMALTTAAFFAFIAGAPYITMTVMGQTPDVYGIYFVSTAFAYMVGNFLSGRYSRRVGTDRMMRLGTSFSLLSVVLEGLVLLLDIWSPATFFLPLAFNALGNGLTLPNATASALSVRPDMAGTASGLAGALQLGLGAGVSYFAGHMVSTWPPALIVIMAGCVVTGFLALRWGRKTV